MNARYTLIVGDLSIDQILWIRDVIDKSPEISKPVKQKVSAAAEAVWEAYRSAKTHHKLWRDYIHRKHPRIFAPSKKKAEKAITQTPSDS